MGCALVDSQILVSHFKHIGVVPSPFSCKNLEPILSINNRWNRFPITRNILGCSPWVGQTRSPEPWRFLTPVTNGKEYRSFGFIQSFSHPIISLFRWYVYIRVAIIIFKIVYPMIMMEYTSISQKFLHQFFHNQHYLACPNTFFPLHHYTDRKAILFHGYNQLGIWFH